MVSNQFSKPDHVCSKVAAEGATPADEVKRRLADTERGFERVAKALAEAVKAGASFEEAALGTTIATLKQVAMHVSCCLCEGCARQMYELIGDSAERYLANVKRKGL